MHVEKAVFVLKQQVQSTRQEIVPLVDEISKDSEHRYAKNKVRCRLLKLHVPGVQNFFIQCVPRGIQSQQSTEFSNSLLTL
jgi:hypothetical protein